MRSRLLVWGLFVLIAGASMVVSQQPGVAQSTRNLQVAIPGYIFSDDLRSWEQIADRSASIPIVVVNPRNGPNVYAGTRCEGSTPPNDPGTGPNLSGLRFDDDFVSTKFPNDPKLVTSQTNYLSTLEQHFVRRSSVLAAAGIGLYGYVWSNTNGADPGCRRTVGIVGDEIDLYKRAYGIQNVFLDDASGACPNDTLRSMTDLAHSKGAKVILNVGSPAGACLATEAEVVVNFEGTPSSYVGSRDALIANAALLRGASPSVKIWHIVYGAVDSDLAGLISQTTTSADYLYVTDDTTQAHGCDRGNSNFDALFGTWPIIRQDIPGCTSRANGSSTNFAAVVTAITQGALPNSASATTVASSLTGSLAPSTTAPLIFAPVTTTTAAPVFAAAPVVSSVTTTSNVLSSSAAPTTSLSTSSSLGNVVPPSSTNVTTTTLLPKVVSTTAVPSPQKVSVTSTTKKPVVSKVTTIRVAAQKKITTKKTAKRSVKKPVVRKSTKTVATRK
jgi:hypothetical protein